LNLSRAKMKKTLRLKAYEGTKGAKKVMELGKEEPQQYLGGWETLVVARYQIVVLLIASPPMPVVATQSAPAPDRRR
jgi:hypothetical protein